MQNAKIPLGIQMQNESLKFKMKKRKKKNILDHDQKLQKPNIYLETQKEHKKWYEIGAMGKQRGKPKAVPPNVKKTGGIKKHSLRKEK